MTKNIPKKIYQVAYPFFSKKDIEWIKEKIDDILMGQLSTGPFTEEFENQFAQFINVKHAVFLNSCTSALEIATSYLNLRNDDEVIVPVETFIATGMAVTSNNGKVVFADIDKDTFCLNLSEIKRLKSNKTKAVMLVHFGGYMSPDTLLIKKYCDENGIFLIEDCAHAIGSEIEGHKTGSIGNVGCFSFFSTKTITTAEGGMFTTNNTDLYEYAKSMRERGRDWKHPTEIYYLPGRSCRVPEFSAVLGINQFSHIKEIMEHREKITEIYDNIINESNYFYTLPNFKNIKRSLWKHITLISDNNIQRTELAKILKNDYGININWAYDPPLHLQPVYKKMFKTYEGMLEKTETLMKKHFHLPLHMLITTEDAEYISNSLIQSVRKII